MKKFILSLLFSVSIICSFAQSYVLVTITNGAATPSVFDPYDIPDYVYVVGSATLNTNLAIGPSSYPPTGTAMTYIVSGTGINLNGHTLTINDLSITQAMLDAGDFRLPFVACCGGDWADPYPYYPSLYNTQSLLGRTLVNGTVELSALADPIPLTSMDTLGRGRIIYGKAANVMSSLYAAGNAKILVGDGTDLNSVSVSGDIGITNAGVSSISSGVIVNADVNSAAAIAFSKMAALTTSKAVVTNSSGVITTANQLSAELGGTAQDFSASTGFQTWSAGTASVGAITESETVWVSFESGYQCDNKIKMPCAGTITGLYAYVVKAVAGTDNGTVVPKNAAGTTMTSGTITFTASDPQGTAYTSTPSANNTFSAGDVLSFTTAKTTVGGVIELTITYTRSN